MKLMCIVLYNEHFTGTFYPDVAHDWAVQREALSNGYPVYSGLMVCPICCRLWAKLIMEDQAFFEARSIPCEQHASACHPDLRPVAGSLLDNPTANGYDEPLLQALPEDLLRREFDLHLKANWDE